MYNSWHEDILTVIYLLLAKPSGLGDEGGGSRSRGLGNEGGGGHAPEGGAACLEGKEDWKGEGGGSRGSMVL